MYESNGWTDTLYVKNVTHQMMTSKLLQLTSAENVNTLFYVCYERLLILLLFRNKYGVGTIK